MWYEAIWHYETRYPRINLHDTSINFNLCSYVDEASVHDLHAEEVDQALQQTLQAIDESEAARQEEEENSDLEAEVDDNASVESFSDIRHSKVRFLILNCLLLCSLLGRSFSGSENILIYTVIYAFTQFYICIYK